MRKQRQILEKTEKYEEWLRGKLGWYRHSDFQGKSVQQEMDGGVVSFFFFFQRLKEHEAEKGAQNIISGFLVTFKREIPISLATISARFYETRVRGGGTVDH